MPDVNDQERQDLEQKIAKMMRERVESMPPSERMLQMMAEEAYVKPKSIFEEGIAVHFDTGHPVIALCGTGWFQASTDIHQVTCPKCRGAYIQRMRDLREQVASLCHEQWSGWMEYLFSKGQFNHDGTWTMPQWAVDRWRHQMKTPYINLSEKEQDSDRAEADKFIDLLKEEKWTSQTK